MKRSFLHLVSQVWLITWLVVFPLFHVHPEADHAHGAAGHVHGGLYHSVLSSDLSCEFHQHPHQRSSGSHEHNAVHMESMGSSTHVLNHAEFSFSLLPRSLGSAIVYPIQTVCLIGPLEQKVILPFSSFETIITWVPPPFWVFVSNHWFRPPPVVSI